jgi:hypothetical protein
MSEAKKGENNPNYGKNHSDDIKKKNIWCYDWKY